MTRLALLFGLLVFAAFGIDTNQAHACGPDADCQIAGDRVYRIKMPDGHDGTTPVGAIVFAHGAGGSAEGVMRNGALLKLASDLGVAVIAGQAIRRAWSIPGIPVSNHIEGVDENVYFDRVLEDATSRFPIDRDRLMMTGFSVGGMMVWNLICHRGDRYAAFVPVAGTFWRPEPETCTSPPASVFHVHGDNDPMVPLKGRQVRDARQGDVRGVLDMYANYGGFTETTTYRADDLLCESRTNAAGQFLDFCLFPGGHSFRIRDLRKAWAKFEETGLL